MPPALRAPCRAVLFSPTVRRASAPSEPMTSFFTRLRERRLVQWTLAYLAGAWLVVEVADVLGQWWGWPPRVVQGLLILLGVGFLVAAVVAWYHGEKGAQRVSGPELLIIALLLAIGGTLVALLGQRGRGGADLATATDDGPAAAAGATAGTETGAASVAVLPFRDLSPGGDQEYFADGIAEEILTALTRVEGLHVASRTSAFRYRNPDRSVPEIGRELGVESVLEGSVRTDGRRIKVTAQLIHAASDRHLWAENYDRELEDVFAVQEEIARAIAGALSVELLAGAGEPVFATTAPEVYRLYLRARHHMGRRTGRDVSRAVEFFDSAVSLDPDYAPAWAGLATGHILASQYTGAPPREALAEGRTVARRALALDPTLGEAHGVVGFVEMHLDYDWVEAEDAFHRAVEVQPGDPLVHHFHAGFLLARGRFDEARAAWRRATELDPVSAIIAFNAAFPDLYQGRLERALAQYRRVLELGPGFDWFRTWIGAVHLQREEYGRAVAVMERSGSSNSHAMGYLGYAYGRAGSEEEARALIRRLSDPDGGLYNAHSVGMIHLGLGDTERALDWLERAYEDRNTHIVEAAVRPELQVLRGHPRFEALLERTGLDDVAPPGGPTP